MSELLDPHPENFFKYSTDEVINVFRRVQHEKALPIRLACVVPFLTKKDRYFVSNSSSVEGEKFQIYFE